MKTLICYGDSNTWGYDPTIDDRYSRRERWAGILRELLLGKYKVIEDGFCGRTTRYSSKDEPFANGLEDAKNCVEEYIAIGVAVIMLGTNDCKDLYQVEPKEIAEGIEQIAQVFEEKGAKILLIAPTPIKNLMESPFQEEFGIEAEKKSEGLHSRYEELASIHGWQFLDAGRYVVPGEYDGIHLDVENHDKLGFLVYEEIKKMEKNYGRQ